MDTEKLQKMEEMFLKTSKPKVIIDKYEKIKKIGCIYDATAQGKNALEFATALAKTMDRDLKIFAADDFLGKVRASTDMIRNREKDILNVVDEYTKEENVAVEIEALVGDKMQEIISFIESESDEEDKLSHLMIDKIIKEEFNIFVAGSPMLRIREEKGYFGFYLRKLLKEHRIKSNFLLVPNEISSGSNMMLGLVNYRQKNDSIDAILKQANSLKIWKKNITLAGILEENTINTVARSEIPDGEEDQRANISEVKERIVGKFTDLLSSYAYKDEEMNLETHMEIGVITAMVKLLLDKHKPSLVLVRNVSKMDENLDPDAETLARVALSDGYPVLLIWD